MAPQEGKAGSIDIPAPTFELQINPDLQGFQDIQVTAVDESLPYKPATRVEVTLANGDKTEIDADTSYAILRDAQGGELSVSAAAAGHVHELHIAGAEPSSQFEVASMDELLGIVAEHLPEDVTQTDGVSALSVETGRSMGNEGVAGLEELLEKGLISAEDIDSLAASKGNISKLNLEGSPKDKVAFVDAYNTQNVSSKIKLQLVRGTVIVPTADAPKQPTTELFMVFGPGKNGKTMYTMAPGRYMPQMPNAAEHTSAEGVVNHGSFQESSDAWLNTVMLTGK